ncbi:ABC transporter permease [Rhizobium sp. CNPSo 3968]|uniref:ABC transporter permease n=1 Tax=Rhizobium sp. CNPSo 3968 TaxID=3021408 RepID=UPI00254EA656|nr:ABC transporter permease [Rhizobium sp. CNPSo 3968]MDK4717901.1 ABC transporter permease [Rhizobium sp. CNPSo 3968]
MALTIENTPSRFALWQRLVSQNLSMVVGGILLTIVLLIALVGPLVHTVDPNAISPLRRLKPPSSLNWFGTDALGRDVLARVIAGGRVSLLVGVSVATLSLAAGILLGLLSGFFRSVDAIMSRILEAFMAIPAVLLAIALIALTKASVGNVIIALTISEIPRVTRLMRSVVLTLRGQPFVEAAIASGAPIPHVLFRHMLPNTLAPLIVQGTFICGSAIIVESILSFIGAGTPSSVPTWGNVIADGRNFFQIYPHMIFFPALFLSVTVLSINLIGDGLRDHLDPRMSRNM